MKKFVSVLLVLCCLMASCVPVLAAVDVWSSDRVIDCIKRAMSDSFDDYSVTRVSSEEFQADIVYDKLLTAKNCQPAYYKALRDSCTETFMLAAWRVWMNYYPTTKITFCFVDSLHKKPIPYCTFTALGSGSNFSFDEQPYGIGIGNDYVALGADPQFMQMLIDNYGAFGTDFIALYSEESGYIIRADSVFSSTFVGYLNAGNTAVVEYLRSIYKYSLWNMIHDYKDCDPNNVSVTVFFADGENYVFEIQYKNGDVTEELLK